MVRHPVGDGHLGWTQATDAGDGCLSAIDTFAEELVAAELVMTDAVAEEFWSTVDGGFLDAVRVRDARTDEIKWVESADLFDPVHRSKTTSKTCDLKC